METTVGLEIHVELKTKSKMFCSCGTQFALPPGSQCCPVCMGLPGALPVINAEAVHLGALAGYGLHSQVQAYSRFDRKQYFYPDLPKGYQITQFYHPLCRGGSLTLPANGRTIHFWEMHLEEDAGKLIHSEDKTYVDLNRCGVPLLEIVTAPELHDGEEAYAFLNLLRDTLVFLGVTTGKMQEGALRVDVNVSVSEKGKPLGERTEMKNLSSFKAVRAAIQHEAKRQEELISQGQIIHRETRRWDEKGGFSAALRSKEAQQDYRYFPEPDLPPVLIPDELLAAWQQDLPELPEQILSRLWPLPGMNERSAALLSNQPKLLQCFDAAYAACGDAKKTLNWLLGDYRSIAKKAKISQDEPPFSPEAFAGFMKNVIENGMVYKEARIQLEKMVTPE